MGDARLQWSFPYPSRRMPVVARRVVATGQPLAAQAGLAVMMEGGNAVDAAIAAAATLTVVEPTANGLGSDAFAILWDGSKLHGLNASGRSPKGAERSRFGDRTRMPTRGWEAVTVPGAVSAWMALSEKFGRLPFARLMEPAIRYAEEGYGVSPQCAQGWATASSRYRGFESWQRTFAPGGAAPAPGAVVRLPHHGATLRDIAKTKGESFYRGALAERIVAAARESGGWLEPDDLGGHRPEWVEPWSVDYRGDSLHELPPNGQGVIALEALGIARAFDLPALDRDCADVLHVQIEAVKAAFADADDRVAEPSLGTTRAEAMISDAFLAERAGGISLAAASTWKGGPLLPGGTVYLCTADDQGMMVSFIQSNYEGFGSGIVIPETGIAMQNRGACFSLRSGHPNEFAPGKRPFHTIIPGFLMRGGAPLAAFGVMGGFMQPQGHLQVAVRMLDHGLNPQAALDAPRFQVLDDGRVAVEPGFPAESLAQLAKRGHDLVPHDSATVLFGGGQVAWRLESGHFVAGSDSRRDGQAVGA